MSHSDWVSSPSSHSTVRPIGVYVLSGLAVDQGRLLAVDTLRGYLVEIDPRTDNTTILNPHNVADWIGVTGLAIWQDQLWLAKGEEIFWCDRPSSDPTANVALTLTAFATLPYPANGLAVWEEQVYVTCQKSGYIHIFDRSSGDRTGEMRQPGIGAENITATADTLWVCDREEQSVYCVDRATGSVFFSALTPFSSPMGIAFYPSNKDAVEPSGKDAVETGNHICYIAYADEEPYIRDDPNSESPHQLTFRDRTFIHPLHIYYNPEQHYALSNGYLVELSYVEELLPLESIPPLHNVEWRIALPADTLRQRVRHVEAIGHPFTEEMQDGQRVAVFKFDTLNPHQGGLVGWKAVLEMYSIKYTLSPADVEEVPPLAADFQQRYLVDDDELSMDTATIRQAAKEASGSETNILRKMLKIRNYVYDRLSYGIQPKIDTPDIALARGVGSCGEYVGVLLALTRLNGIACRTIGRYKCPPYPERRNLPLEPDFNHVWLEFYVPGIGWLPMESNVDDVIDRGPYPTRFFMGLAWYHTELGKGIPFAKLKADDRPEKMSLGDLAINHIRFTILDELRPGAPKL